MKRFIALALCLILATTVAAAPSFWTKTAEADHHRALVKMKGPVIVNMFLGLKYRKTGSGTVIRVTESHVYIVSCRHVFVKGNEVDVHFLGGQIGQGVVIKDGGREVDLCLIACKHKWLNWKQVSFVPVAEVAPKPGQFVECTGYGADGDGGDNLRHWVAQIRSYRPRTGAMVLETSCVRGDSGGGVTFGGRLVGVIVGGRWRSHADGTKDDKAMFTHPALAINVQQIQTFLEGALP